MMKYTLFPSMGFTICALVFTILVGFMYLSKKKFKNLENNVYATMLLLTVILLVLEIACVCTMSIRDKIPLLNEVLCRGYILGTIIWVTCLIIYIWSMSDKNKEKRNYKKTNLIISLISFISIIMLFIISCLSPITYEGGNGELYVIGGPAVNVIYLAGFVVIVMLLLAMFKNSMKLPLSQRAPIYFVIVFFVIVTAFQILGDYDFNDLTYIFAFCVMALYFTVESQDNKLLNELEKSKEEAELADKAKTEFLSNQYS